MAIESVGARASETKLPKQDLKAARKDPDNDNDKKAEAREAAPEPQEQAAAPASEKSGVVA